MFTTPCFIRKNTPKLRKKLEELGYKKQILYKDTDPYLCAWESFGIAMYVSEIDSDIDTKTIDCGENEELFLALVALRDNSDYMQWIINNHTGQYKLCAIELLENENFEWEDWTKATPQELIEHFKKE